jgi:hypothetical protein
LSGKAKVVNHWNKELYECNRQRFGYNQSIPVLSAGYSSSMGFGVNFGYKFTVRKFEKDDYHSTHAIVFGLTTERNIKASYAGRFHQAFREWDLEVNASLDDATVRNRFFGVGNDAENLEDEFGLGYFQPVLSKYLFSLGLVRYFWQKSYFKVNAGVEMDDSKSLKYKFLSNDFQSFYGANHRLYMVPVGIVIDMDF